MFKHGLLACALLPFISSLGPAPLSGAEASIIPSPTTGNLRSTLDPRQSSADTCFRWAQQSTIINGTLWLYGGHSSTSSDQEQNTWNNDLISVDLTTRWAIAAPSQSAHPKPPAPPVSNGFLWANEESVFLFGGEYSDKPEVSPQPFKLYEYAVSTARWITHDAPQTSGGTNAADGGIEVQTVAEGAGAVAPGLGRGWYFGGHQDYKTTAGWSIQTPRVYIKSLLEFTFPGSTNAAVDDLSNNKQAGSVGAWRNITEGGAQEGAGFPERADGVLVYVPGIGDQGVLVGLAGGTASKFSQMNVVDVFDIATSQWYKQGTAGTTPKLRVNPCAVVAAAADGTSYNIYLYGGQDLQPDLKEAQVQLDDLWVLSLPSFTYVRADTSGQSIPPARAGHACVLRDAQMIVSGGYETSADVTCDSPGIYVFNTSSLAWIQTFQPVSDMATNPQSKQLSQIDDETALRGSYSYQVAPAIVNAIGGGPAGGATLTVPVASATAGPLATGKPKTYKVDGGPNGSDYKGFGNANENNGNGGSNKKTKTIAIAVGVVAGVLALAVIYLAICAFLYRKRLRQYQAFMEADRAERTRNAMSNTASNSSGAPTSRSGGKRGDYYAVDSGYNSGSGRESGEKTTPGRRDSTDDLMAGQEPTFVGIMLHPRRSLRVVNR